MPYATSSTIYHKILLITLVACFAITHALADMRSYKIGSWNLNDTQMPIEEKWNNTIRSLLSGSNGVDILALQEVGGLPTNVEFLNTFTLPYAITLPIQEYQWNLGRGYGKVYVYFMRTDTNMRGINLAIITKKRASEIFAIKSSSKTSLPMLAIALGNDVFITMDSLDRKGADTLANVTNVFDYFSKHQRAQSLQWLILGSFNIHPQALQSAIPPKLQERIAIIAPSVATRKSGGIFEYALSGNSGESPYLAPTLNAYLGYGNVRQQFDSVFIPIIFSK